MKRLAVILLAAAALVGVASAAPTGTTPLNAQPAEAAVVYKFRCMPDANLGFVRTYSSSNPTSARVGCFNKIGADYFDWVLFGVTINCPGSGRDLNSNLPGSNPFLWWGQYKRNTTDNPLCGTDLSWKGARGYYV